MSLISIYSSGKKRKALHKRASASSRGFTLVEMIITLGIAGMIFAVVLFNQGDFIDRFALSSAATDFELMVRQAQVFGVSVREFSPSSSEFQIAYGVSVILSSLVSGGDSFAISFADRGARNGFYDGTATCVVDSSSECLQRFNFERGIRISNICFIPHSGPEQCGGVARTDITFNRPDPAARIVLIDGASEIIPMPIKGVRIEFESPRGNKRSVVVFITGQISLQ